MLAIRKPRKYEHYNLKKIGEYPLEERLEMLKNFYKFTVVRDPIERILSAYKDKARAFTSLHQTFMSKL